MIQFDYESLDFKNKITSCKLSSVFGEDNFFYGAFDSHSGKLVKAKYVTDMPPDYLFDEQAVRKLLKDEGFGHLTISESAHSFVHHAFSLLPVEFELKKNTPQWNQLPAIWTEKGFESRVQTIDTIRSELHFPIPKALLYGLDSQFPGAHICHFNGALVSTLTERKIKDTYVFVHVFGRTLQIVVIIDNELKQTNSYELSGGDDVLYYTLLNCTSHDLDPMHTPVFYAGPIQTENQNIQLLADHFTQLQPLAIKDRLKYANVFLGKPKHLFYGLQAVWSCVS